MADREDLSRPWPPEPEHPPWRNLAVPYHQQENDHFCGATSAQMVIASIGGGLIDQAAAYTDARGHTIEPSSWAMAPDGLEWLLDDRRPPRPHGYLKGFVLASEPTADALTRTLIWTIHHYGVAPITLVHLGQHWVVVRGYSASAFPRSARDTDYRILTIWINDPWPPVPAPLASPPPHSARDGCGSGGNRGTPNVHITYAAWRSDYITPIIFGTAWRNRHVAVCFEDRPFEEPSSEALSAHLIEEYEPLPERLPGDRLIEPEQAVERALAGARGFGLLQHRNWAEVFERAGPTTPVLVQRLDILDSFYWLVPFADHGGTVTGVIDVDGRFGDYRQSMVLPEPEADLFSVMDDEAVLERTVGQRLELEKGRGSVPLRKEAFSLYPTYVWRPCLESLSPFWPFRMITVGDQRVYVRVDGEIFTTLHTDIGGA